MGLESPWRVDKTSHYCTQNTSRDTLICRCILKGTWSVKHQMRGTALHSIATLVWTPDKLVFVCVSKRFSEKYGNPFLTLNKNKNKGYCDFFFSEFRLFFLTILTFFSEIWLFFSEIWLFFSKFRLFSHNSDFFLRNLTIFLRNLTIFLTIQTFFSEIWLFFSEIWLFFSEI